MRLSVIIVNYNVGYFLEQCLYSVQRALEGLDGEVIVIDNGSTDGSIEYLTPLFPQVKWISAHTNLGFAKANNRALLEAQGEYILFLNPDTLLPENSLHSCLHHMAQHPSIGALGVRMVDGKGRFLPESKRSFPSPWVSFAKLAGLSWLFPRSKRFNRYALGYLDEHVNHSVEVLAGACMFVRHQLLQQLQGFDESYFLYGEDIDLSFRIKAAGYENVYFAGTTILHFKGESSRNKSLTRLKYFYGAMLVFVRKHYRNSSSRAFAGVLSLAIGLHGAVAAMWKIVRPLLLPLTDLLLLWSSLDLVRQGWIHFVRGGDDFKVPFIQTAQPLFALLFVLSAALAGLYERKLRTSRMLTAAAFATLCMLAAYALLPENIRFSRGVIVGGGMLGAVLVFLFRRLLLATHSSLVIPGKMAGAQTVLVCAEEEYAHAQTLLEHTLHAQPLGRIALRKQDNTALCHIDDLALIEKNFPINRIIFCAGTYGWEELIAAAEKTKASHKQFLFHAIGSGSMIGSQAPDATVVTPEIDYHLSHAYHRRMKRVVDVKTSLLFILFFPLHFLLHRHPLLLLWNSLRVLAGKRTWIGYGEDQPLLPPLKPGIVSSLGLAHNTPAPLSSQADALYARNYDWWQDFLKVLSNYRHLG